MTTHPYYEDCSQAKRLGYRLILEPFHRVHVATARRQRELAQTLENNDFSLSWWDHRSVDGDESYTLLEVRQGGVEVARIELDPGVVIDHYLETPALGNTALEIELIEVAESHRRRGIGTKIVRALASRYPERRLLAFSEEADDFWASLGWTRYDHPEGPQLNRPLFIQPAEGV